MISKIQTIDYLKRMGNMTEEERADYMKRVVEWDDTNSERLMKLSEQNECLLQNVQMASMAWNDADCQAWNEGVLLLSALTLSCDTWLPDALYTKSAKRCIQHMTALLNDVLTASEQQTVDNSQADGANDNIAKSKDGKDEKQTVDAGAGLPVRPKHIDQYVHLLPQKTQERAAQVCELLRDMDTAREKLRLLTETPKSSATDRESWAKKVKAIDDKVRSIYNELDHEWERLAKTGVITVDCFGNARINPSVANGEVMTDVIDEQPQIDNEVEQHEKVAKLRRWLIDTRKTGNIRHNEKWTKNYQEMVQLGGREAVTDKVKEAAKHYGIDLDKLPAKP